MLELIGGIAVEGKLRRDVVLAPLTGAVEFLLAELGGSDLSHPQKVSVFLSNTVASIGGQPVQADALSVADRQHLVRQIGAVMGVDLVWLSGECTGCGETFEIPVQQAEMPVKPAGVGFPEQSVEIDGVRIMLRVPTGADQAAIAHCDPQEAAALLLDRLITVPEGVSLTKDQRADLEHRIEDLSAEVALEVVTACPDCEKELRVYVDPYLALNEAGAGILDDIHVLARSYHWAQSEILALPRRLRQAYLTLIDRDRGMATHPSPEMGP